VTVTVSEAATAQKHASAFFQTSTRSGRCLVRDGRSRSRRSRQARLRPGSPAHVRCGEFLNNRYLDSSTGTFLSVDPLVAITGYPYLYGDGNPITFTATRECQILCVTDRA
jgi:hypothetical protein